MKKAVGPIRSSFLGFKKNFNVQNLQTKNYNLVNQFFSNSLVNTFQDTKQQHKNLTKKSVFKIFYKRIWCLNGI